MLRLWVALWTMCLALVGAARVLGASLPSGGEIAFISDRGGLSGIYLMDVALGILQPVRLGGMPVATLAWSPNGDSLAFTGFSPDDGEWNLYLWSVKAQAYSRLVEHVVGGIPPIWLPDNHHIVFSPFYDGRYAVMDTFELNSGDVRQLKENLSRTIAPAWSPDGRHIAFVLGDVGGAQIWVSDVGGGNMRQFTREGKVNSLPAWSPDGEAMAFMSTRSGSVNIWTMRLDGTNSRQLTNDDAIDYAPAWSPDGRWIVFVSTRDGNREIYLTDSTGNRQRRLTWNNASDASPLWRP
jgi:TolB protein